MSNRFQEHVLANGLRVVTEQMEGVRSAAAGFLCSTGARDEMPSLAGVSHFLEHMCFKGTPNRSAERINLDLDEIGSQPNAFTSHDRTFYHGVTRTADINRLIEVLADMMSSVLPDDEFTMEKKVVLEEIAMNHDRIEHIAFDLIVENVFAGNSLGWPVLGYEKTIEPLTRDQMAAYFAERYNPANLTLVAAGGMTPEAVHEAAERWCSAWQRGPARPPRMAPKIHAGATDQLMDRFNQQVVAVVYPAPSAVDPLHDTAEALASILSGANSRFYWNIEQAGLCPYAGAYRLDFGDCGLLILLAQCDPENLEQVHDALRTEARRLMEGPIETNEIERVKNKRRTSLAVEGESPYYRLLQVMDDVDYRGAPRSMDDRLADVDAVGQSSVRAYFEQFPVDGAGYFVTVGPRAAPAAG